MIPNEKLLSLSSFQASLNYFSYEANLHVFDHSEEEELSLSDKDVVTVAVLDSRFMEFGSFHSNLVHCDLVPIKPMKPEIKGSAIKIGEITCFLAAFDSSSNSRWNISNQNSNGGYSVCNTMIIQDPELKILCLPLQDPRQCRSRPRQLGLIGFCKSVASFVDSVFLALDPVRFPCFQLKELVSATTMPSSKKMNDCANLLSVSTATDDCFMTFDPAETLAAAYNSISMVPTPPPPYSEFVFLSRWSSNRHCVCRQIWSPLRMIIVFDLGGAIAASYNFPESKVQEISFSICTVISVMLRFASSFTSLVFSDDGFAAILRNPGANRRHSPSTSGSSCNISLPLRVPWDKI